MASVEDPVTGTITYDYTPIGSVATKRFSPTEVWTYTYGAPGNYYLPKDDPNSVTEKLASIVDDQNRLVEFDLDQTGFMRTAKFNQTFQNGNLVSYCKTEYILDGTPGAGYGSKHQLQEIRNTWNWKDGMGVWQWRNISTNTYAYDNVGNRTSNTILDWNQSTRIEEYGYDALYRLNSVIYGDGQIQGYTFDPMGNRLTKTDNQNPSETYVSNAANMTTSRNGQPYTYDANGNTLTGGGRTNVWDSQNRMYSCAYAGNTNVFTYGSDGLRRASVTNGTRTDFAIDGDTVVREMRDINSDGNLESIATYFGGMYKRDDINGTLRWYIYDGLGSVLAEVDPSGNVTAGRKYDVYGLVRSGQAGISKHKFVGKLGHVSEDETGLIYMRARYMDPVLGKFVSEDPARNGANWYTYCNNNPVNLVDNNGKNPILIAGVILAGIIAGIANCVLKGWSLENFLTAAVVAAGVSLIAVVAGPYVAGLFSILFSVYMACCLASNINSWGIFAAVLSGLLSGALCAIPGAGNLTQSLTYWAAQVSLGLVVADGEAYASEIQK